MAEKVRMQDFGKLHTQIQARGGVWVGPKGQGEQKPVQHLLNASELGWETRFQPDSRCGARLACCPGQWSQP